MSNHVLILIHSAERGCEVPIGREFSLISELVVVGRASEADVRLEDASVSRRHLELRPSAEGVRVKSVSRNGTTFINGHRVDPGAEVLVEQATLRAASAAGEVQEDLEEDEAALLRTLLTNVRRVGYALKLPASEASIKRL